MKKLVLIFAMIIPLSLMTFAQADYSSSQMFGSKRPTTDQMSYDFSKISADVVQHEFTVTNDNEVEITITSIEIPDGCGVVVIDKTIPAKSDGKIIVSIYKRYISTGDFNKKIIVHTEYNILGTINKAELTYTVEGNL